jgi:hypothetical protein
MSIPQRALYSTGLVYYIASALTPTLVPVPFIAMVFFAPKEVRFHNWVFVVPALLSNVLLWAVLTRPHTLSFLQFQIYTVQLFHVYVWSFIAAIKDLIFGSVSGWVATGAATSRNRSHRFARNACRIWVVGTYAVAVGGTVWRVVQGYHVIQFVPSLIIMTLNLLSAMPFMLAPLDVPRR